MKKCIKFYKLLLVCFIMFLGFLNPAIADTTTSGDSNSGNIVGNSDDNVYVDDRVGISDGNEVIDSDAASHSSNTDLTTLVPAVVDIIIIGPGGSVAHGGKIYGNNDTLQTTDMTFNISPAEGYRIGEVYWNSVDVTAKLRNGVLKLSDVEDGVLKVIFVQIPVDEEQEKQLSSCCTNAKCKCKGQCKCKTCSCVDTADSFDIAYYFAIAMFVSVIVFVLTLGGGKVCLSAREGRTYKKKSVYPKYKRLRI